MQRKKEINDLISD